MKYSVSGKCTISNGLAREVCLMLCYVLCCVLCCVRCGAGGRVFLCFCLTACLDRVVSFKTGAGLCTVTAKQFADETAEQNIIVGKV